MNELNTNFVIISDRFTFREIENAIYKAEKEIDYLIVELEGGGFAVIPIQLFDRVMDEDGLNLYNKRLRDIPELLLVTETIDRAEIELFKEFGELLTVLEDDYPLGVIGGEIPKIKDGETVTAYLNELISWRREDEMGEEGVPTKTVMRYTDVSFPSKVTLGKLSPLRVAIRMKRSGPHGEQLILDLPDDVTKDIIVYVYVSAEDFEIEGDYYRPLKVPREGDSSPIIFNLFPRQLGEKEIKVEFFQNGRYVGQSSLKTIVVKEEVEAKTKESKIHNDIEVERIYRPPDLTIMIEEREVEEGQMRYEFTLFSPLEELALYPFRKCGETIFKPPLAWIEEMRRELEELGRKREYSPPLVAKKLAGIGLNLYEQLLPKEVKDIYWEIRDKIKSIMVISEEPWIPWEILKPYRETENDYQEDEFMCERFSFSRWILGKAPPSTLRLSYINMIIPDAGLENAKREKEYLNALKNRGAVVSDIIPNMMSVYDVLEEGGFDLLHFAGHGEYNSNNPDLSVIYMEDGELTPMDIAGRRMRFGKKNRPLVFINACQTSIADFSLTGIGGWASRFIKAGSAIFVGTLWSVDDKLACDFSQEFYERLWQGMTVGEAFREARNKIKGTSDPTWLAYSLYGDPLAKVE